MSRDGREARKQDGTRMRHAIKHPVVHNVPTNNLIVPRHASLITISPSTSFAHEYEFSRTYARSRTNRPGHPTLYIYIYIFRLEMDKNLKNEIIALITRVITLQLTSHFFPFPNWIKSWKIASWLSIIISSINLYRFVTTPLKYINYSHLNYFHKFISRS